MPSGDREVAALEGEISQLEGTAATLRTHKDHFDTLIADHEKDGSGGGFFSALTDALEGLAGVIDNGIFGSADDADDADAGSSGDAKKKGKGIHSAVKGLQSAGDTTDAERADTVAHLRQVASDIQVRLDALTGQIDEKKTRLKAVQGDVPPKDTGNDEDPVVVPRRDDPARRTDPVDPVVDPVIPVAPPEPDAPVVPVTPPEPDAPVAPVIDLPDVPTIVVPPSVIENIVDVPDVVPVIDLPDVPTIVVPPSVIDDITTNIVDPTVVPVRAPDYTPTFDPTAQVEIGELDGEIYDVEALLRSGKSVADLRARDIPAGILTAFGVGAGALIGAGYPVPELREAGLDAAALRSEGVTIAALREAGYGIEDLRTVATVAELRTFASAEELHAAGLGAAELRDAFPASDLVRIFSVHELKDAGFRLDDLRESVAVSELRTAYDVSELVAAFSVRDLHDAGVSAADLLHAGTSLSSLQDAGFSYQDLVGAGASASELATLFPHEASAHDGPMSGGGY